jgi:hypothetical protein
VGCLLAPLAVIALASAIYVLSVLTALANLPSTSAGLVAWYQQTLDFLFSPPVLPTIMPRAVVLAVLAVAGVLLVAAIRTRKRERTRRRARGAFWWRLIGQPLDAQEPEGLVKDALWKLTRGATALPRSEMGRRYVDLLIENFGQPGFREVMLAVHDVDARRDVVCAVLVPQWQQAFSQRRVGAGPREAEAFDLVEGREHDRGVVMDFLVAGLRVPVASAPHEVTFPDKGYWQGETHRWCDRPELVGRLVDELTRVPSNMPPIFHNRHMQLNFRATCWHKCGHGITPVLFGGNHFCGIRPSVKITSGLENPSYSVWFF